MTEFVGDLNYDGIVDWADFEDLCVTGYLTAASRITATAQISIETGSSTFMIMQSFLKLRQAGNHAARAEPDDLGSLSVFSS